ncbi:MAG TPA: ribonuclease H-like domain-containing protein [Candidatus Sulfomarinibacteraceae bacterium]|nr:ribonuclease H-like domain-containing protein [Candidatus Sulfomarinibacteraceae bacterium]
MNREALARLRRLGVVKGVRNLKSAQSLPTSSKNSEKQEEAPYLQAPDGDPQPLPTLLPGLELAETAEGACYVLDKVYPLDHRHGTARLHELLELATEAVACFCQDERLGEAHFRDYLFLDTETTGLGGAGTLAFMVGAAFFEDDAFVVRQYFLRDHGDEPAMLLMLDELLQERAGLVTFNGQSFDLPLLESRFLLNRMPLSLREWPHLDLLPPSRRLWRRRFDSCALGALEQNVLGLTRTHQDVPGWLIPSLYNHFLRTGDGRELSRVFYHNRMDMLSMVSLATRIVRQFEAPQAGDHPIDLLGLGKWQADLGLKKEAEQTLRLAATPDLPTDLYRQALLRLGYLLKRAGRREEAVEVWQQVACISFEDVTAHVELAKQYEWHNVNLQLAQTWTERALALVDGAAHPQVRAELEHRLQRLKRKQTGVDE